VTFGSKLAVVSNILPPTDISNYMTSILYITVLFPTLLTCQLSHCRSIFTWKIFIGVSLGENTQNSAASLWTWETVIMLT